MEHGRATHRVPDEKLGRIIVSGHVFDNANDVIDITGKVGLGKVAITVTDAGKVKAQYANALFGKFFTNNYRKTSGCVNR
jgi:hypothetical protein